jgi:hypothetical protein
MKRLTRMTVCVLMLAGSRAEAFYYSVTPPRVDMRLSYGLESTEWQPAGTSRDVTILRQKFDISSRGWAYHPHALQFKLGLRPEFEQRDTEWSTGAGDERRGTYLGFLLDAHVLPYEPYSLKLHATRDRRDVATSRALGDTTTDYSLYRATVLAQHPVLPTLLTVESSDRTSETFLGTRTEQTERLYLSSNHFTPASRTRMEAEARERTQAAGDFASTSEQLTVRGTNELQLGERTRAVSRLRFADRSSPLVSSQMTSLGSRVTVDHHQDLDTRYEVAYDDHRNGDFQSTRSYASAGLRHQYYSHLATKLAAELERRDSTDAEIDNARAAADFAYTRPIPWGRLFLDYGHEQRFTDQQRELTAALARGEAHVLTGGIDGRVPLHNVDIDINTIEVTDADGNPFLELEDYELEQDGDLVYLSRTLFGRIEDGEEVLGNYAYRADPSAKLTQMTNSFGAAVDLWSTLRLYHSRSISDVDVRAGIEPDGTAHRSELTGAAVRWRWGPASSSTTLEQAELDTAFVAKKTTRARQLLTIGTWSSTELEAEDEMADEWVEPDNGNGGFTGFAQTRTKILRARQRFTAGTWSATDFEGEDRRVTGDITHRTEVPARTLRLRQTLTFGWSTTTVEGEDITINGDPADFPPTSFRSSVTPATTWRLRQSFALRPIPAMRVGLAANYFVREPKDAGFRSEGGGYSGTLSWNLGRIGRFNARANHQRSWSGLQQSERLGLDLRHEFSAGAWQPSVRYSFSEESRSQPLEQSRRDSLLYFELKRSFW